MTILSEALTRAEAAESVATDLLRHLSSVRAELLELERLGRRGDAGLHVVDRAEDMRRHLGGPLRDIALSIRDALQTTETAYFRGAASGAIDSAHARTMIGVVLQTAREVRHLQLAIAGTADALQDVTPAPSGAMVSGLSARSLQNASTSLEQAHRCAYRTREDLSVTTRSLLVDVASLVGDRVEAGVGLPSSSFPVDRPELIHEAVVHAERLRDGLDGDLAELIEIESLVDDRGCSLLVIDRAEDLRRSLRDERAGQAQRVRDALHQIEMVLSQMATDGDIEPGTARSMTARALQSSKVVRHLQLDLGNCVDSLGRLAQSPPIGDLTEEASSGTEAAKSGLDDARLSAWRLSEDIPVLARAVAPHHERPLSLSLVLDEAVKQLAPAGTSFTRARAADPVSPASRSARPVGFDR